MINIEEGPFTYSYGSVPKDLYFNGYLIPVDMFNEPGRVGYISFRIKKLYECAEHQYNGNAIQLYESISAIIPDTNNIDEYAVFGDDINVRYFYLQIKNKVFHFAKKYVDKPEHFNVTQEDLNTILILKKNITSLRTSISDGTDVNFTCYEVENIRNIIILLNYIIKNIYSKEVNLDQYGENFFIQTMRDIQFLKDKFSIANDSNEPFTANDNQQLCKLEKNIIYITKKFESGEYFDGFEEGHKTLLTKSEYNLITVKAYAHLHQFEDYVKLGDSLRYKKFYLEIVDEIKEYLRIFQNDEQNFMKNNKDGVEILENNFNYFKYKVLINDEILLNEEKKGIIVAEKILIHILGRPLIKFKNCTYHNGINYALLFYLMDQQLSIIIPRIILARELKSKLVNFDMYSYVLIRNIQKAINKATERNIGLHKDFQNKSFSVQTSIDIFRVMQSKMDVNVADTEHEINPRKKAIPSHQQESDIQFLELNFKLLNNYAKKSEMVKSDHPDYDENQEIEMEYSLSHIKAEVKAKEKKLFRSKTKLISSLMNDNNDLDIHYKLVKNLEVIASQNELNSKLSKCYDLAESNADVNTILNSNLDRRSREFNNDRLFFCPRKSADDLALEFKSQVELVKAMSHVFRRNNENAGANPSDIK